MRISLVLTVLCLFLTPAWAGPHGDFLFGESDGEDFVFQAVLKSDTIQLTPLNGDTDISAPLKELRDGVYTFEVEWDDKRHQMTLVEIDRSELLLVSDHEKEALRGWRISSKPSLLQGRWTEEGSEDHSFSMQGQEMKLLGGGKEKKVRVYPVASDGRASRMVLLDPENGGEDGILLNYVLLTENSVLMWDQDDGKTKRFHRSGWLSK